MNREDKNKIFIAIFFVGFWLLVAVFAYLQQFINTLWIGVLFLLYQQLYLLPKINRLYFRLNEIEGGKVTRYIPLLNETAIFPPFWSKLTLVTGSIIAILAIISLLPVIGVTFLTNMIRELFGEAAAMNYTFYTILFAIVFYVIINVIRGMAFVEIKRNIDYYQEKYFGKVGYMGFESAQYLLLFIPFGRTIALAYMADRLYKLTVLNDIQNLQDTKFVEEM